MIAKQLNPLYLLMQLTRNSVALKSFRGLVKMAAGMEDRRCVNGLYYH